jgi:hypothetical protein
VGLRRERGGGGGEASVPPSGVGAIAVPCARAEDDVERGEEQKRSFGVLISFDAGWQGKESEGARPARIDK